MYPLMNRITFLLLIFGHFTNAVADVSNRNLFPVGERESALANVGITSQSGGAVFYNPANLLGIEHPSISMTGTTLMRFQSSTDAFFVIGDITHSYDATGFLAIPASLVSTYKFGKATLATSILVPDAFELNNRGTFDFEDIKTTLIFTQKAEDLWLGVSAAYPLSEKLSFGVSVFGINRKESSFSFFRIQNTFVPEEGEESLFTTDNSVLGLSAVLGLAWQPHPKLRIGIRSQTPLLQLIGTDSIYSSTLTFGSGELIELERNNTSFNRPLPWDVGMGLSVKLHKKFELMMDVNVQMPLSYFAYSDPALRDSKTVYELAHRFGVACEYTYAKSFKYQLGIGYNNSASATVKEPGDFRENYVNLASGISWQSGRTRTGLGVFYLRGKGEMFPIGDADKSVDTNTQSYGGIITVSYNL